jgi:predicted nucleic acid-binding protein
LSRFFDTNILVYAFLDFEKRQAALEILSEGGVISAQVLNEFTSVARNKRQRAWPEIDAALAVIHDRFPNIVPLTADIHASAVSLTKRFGFSFYDALIVATASEAGCKTLYSEDMQHSGRFADLTIVNPFRPV